MKNYFTFSSKDSTNMIFAPSILNTEEIYEECPKCHIRGFKDKNFQDKGKKIVLIAEGKGGLPDLLGCGAYPLTLISERTLCAWQTAGITGYEFYSVELQSETRDLSHARYYNITITGRAELDFKKMKLKIKKQCPVCGNVKKYNKETWEFGKTFMKENSYDGSDIFVFEHFERSEHCNIKLVETVLKEKLNGFQFGHGVDSFNFTSSSFHPALSGEKYLKAKDLRRIIKEEKESYT